MSVQVNTYVILGTRLEYEGNDCDDDAQYDRFENWMDSAFKPRQMGMVCLFDGMNGDYVFLGHVLAVTEDHDHFHDPQVIDVTEKQRESVKDELSRVFGLENPEVKTWIVSHYR